MEEPCLATPLLISEDPLGLNPLMEVIPLARLAFPVIEDGPASETVLIDADEVDDLSERGMYILSVEELCEQEVRSMTEPEGLEVWLSIRCLL